MSSKIWIRLGVISAGIIVAFCLMVWLVFLGVRWYFAPQLPPLDKLHEVQLGAPLRVFTSDGKLIGRFGAELRDPLRYDQFPPHLIQAFLAAEDENFFAHPGVDWEGLARASLVLFTTGEKRQGGSTITMQLARNLFLSSERTYQRKIKEILLALRIEHELSKQQILELYLNRIFLGNRAYGVGAAAQLYFGKNVNDLTVPEMATLAGLPKAPSRDNPLADPARATDRRNYVLRRLRDLGWISKEAYRDALQTPMETQEHSFSVEGDADYVAEMARNDAFARFGESAYTEGLDVTTTINSQMQSAAIEAIRSGLIEYERRHGYRGPEAHLEPNLAAELAKDPESRQVMDDLNQMPVVGGLVPAVVVSLSSSSMHVLTAEGPYAVPATGLAWAHLGPRNALKAGDIIRIAHGPENSWWLAQQPKVEGAMVVLAPGDGAVRALVGGFDFHLNRFNRAVQMRRQIGSGFKPLLYAAALSNGYSPASVFLDAPVVTMDSTMADAWRPEDDNGRFLGPMRLREALVRSRNLVSIRLLQTLGMTYVRHFIPPRFGISAERLPRDLTMALGTALMSPMEVARAYAVFANGGYLVQPYIVNTIVGADGRERYRAQPPTICTTCPPTGDEEPVSTGNHAPQVLDPQTTFLMQSMMHDVVVRGTGAEASVLGRHDLAGKTGTTNDESDAWFDGFNRQLVGVCWVGFDQPQSLGDGEYGARAALPIWIKFMRVALHGMPDVPWQRPEGIIDIRVNPKTGRRLADDDPNGVPEMISATRAPAQDEAEEADEAPASAQSGASSSGTGTSNSDTSAAQGLY